MTYNAAALNDAVLGTWGETATLWVGNVANPIVGIFSSPRAAAVIGGVRVDRIDPVFAVRSADFTPLNAATGARLDIGARRYTIVRIRPDDAGMTELDLREFA
mgnify:CR=1 FL=1